MLAFDCAKFLFGKCFEGNIEYFVMDSCIGPLILHLWTNTGALILIDSARIAYVSALYRCLQVLTSCKTNVLRVV